MSHYCEHETTCGIVFDGAFYGRVVSLLTDRIKTKPVSEVVDIHRDPENANGRYRSITGYSDHLSVDYKRFDHKISSKVVETQIPYVEESRGRVIFITGTYKESTERVLTEQEWAETVKENHATGHYVRIYNKKRLCFFHEAARVTVGEFSLYGGTLEARTTCNSIYYLEIELESDRSLNGKETTDSLNRLCAILFDLLPYDMVSETMSASNSISVQRERFDSIFDTFKRRFLDYNRWKEGGGGTDAPLEFYVMPKWDGIRATGIYYREGFLVVKDACGRMASYRTALPFDNDMILQLEVLKGPRADDRRYVITELMAVMVKSQNTVYAVYGRNNAIHNTGRNTGNVATGIAIKTQFSSNTHVCSLYRSLPAGVSLRVLSKLTAIAARRIDTADSVRTIKLTGVVNLTNETGKGVETVLGCLDLAFTGGRESRREALEQLSAQLPKHLLHDYENDCEGLIVAFVKHRTSSPFQPEQHGYFKVKHVDTVDLEFDLDTGKVMSADRTEYVVDGLPTLDTIEDWSERPTPLRNRCMVVECIVDAGNLRYMKDRCDKNRPDSDDKIKCAVGKLFK